MNKNWQAERDRQRIERDQRRFERAMQAPLSRGENVEQISSIQASMVSTALALESLELLLVSKGILKEDELMERLGELVKERAAQARAADAVEPEPPRIITPV